MTTSNRASGSVFAAAGAALIAGFFLTWIDLGIASASGFDLAREPGWKHHLLALMPLAGLGILLAAARDRRLARQLGLATGVLVGGYVTFEIGRSVIDWLRWGGWIAAAGGAVMIGSARGPRSVTALAAAVAAAAFFLPWYGGASGFDIARESNEIARLAPIWLALLGAGLGALSVLGAARRPALAVAGGALIAIALMWPYVVVAHVVLGLGAWLTLGGSATALVGGLVLKS
jgi:hypothetical protein